MTVVAFAKAAIVSAAGAYPFLWLVKEVATLDPQKFEPCNDACIGKRYFGSQDMPSTRLEPVNNNKTFEIQNIVSRYVVIRNGYAIQSFGIESTKPALLLGLAFSLVSKYEWLIFEIFSWGADKLPYFLHLGSSAKLATKFQSPLCPRFDANSTEMAQHCSSNSMKEQVQNHLNLESTLVSSSIYATAICGWAVLKILHDFVLLAGWTVKSEALSLSLGLGSVACQLLATVMAFWLMLGAAGIFIAMDAQEDCACYYRLPGFQMILMFSSPLLLMSMLLSKIECMGRALLCGDYIFAISYDIPYRIVSANIPHNPMGLMLGPHLRSDEDGAEPQALSFQAFYKLARVFDLLFWCIGSAADVVSGPIIGPVLSRLFFSDNFEFRKVAWVACIMEAAFLAMMLTFALYIRRYQEVFLCAGLLAIVGVTLQSWPDAAGLPSSESMWNLQFSMSHVVGLAFDVLFHLGAFPVMQVVRMRALLPRRRSCYCTDPSEGHGSDLSWPLFAETNPAFAGWALQGPLAVHKEFQDSQTHSRAAGEEESFEQFLARRREHLLRQPNLPHCWGEDDLDTYVQLQCTSRGNWMLYSFTQESRCGKTCEKGRAYLDRASQRLHEKKSDYWESVILWWQQCLADCKGFDEQIAIAKNTFKITLLRVIPTMTCWVEVVRWGLSLRIW